MSDLSLQQLPLVIIINILGNLNLSDLRNVMLTCKTLRDLILNERSIWRLVCRNKLVIQDTDNSQSIPLSAYERPLCLSGIQRTRISLNWARGIYKSLNSITTTLPVSVVELRRWADHHAQFHLWSDVAKTANINPLTLCLPRKRYVILHHQTKYMPWLKVYKSEALLLSLGPDLQCYPVDKKKCYPAFRKLIWKLATPVVQRYDVRTNDISRFIVKDDFIVSGNRDGCVGVYKMENVWQKPKLLHHIKDCHDSGNAEVTAVELINSNCKPYVVTASSACSNLCFWSLTPDSSDSNHGVKCTSEVGLGKGIGIRCLDVHSAEDKLAIGLNGNNKPLLLDVTTGGLLLNTKTMANAKHAVRDVGWHNNNTIMYVTHSGVLQFLDVRSGNVVFDVMDPFQSTMYCVKSDNNNAVVVGTSEYCRCVLFDTRNSAGHVQLYFTQKKLSPVYSLDFDPIKLIAAADQSVAVLNFGTRSDTALRHDYSEPFEFVTR